MNIKTTNQATSASTQPPSGAEPTDADWAEREAAAKGDTDPDAGVAKPAERREPGHIDSALESLGEAISDPVREAAEEVSNDTETDAKTRPSR